MIILYFLLSFSYISSLLLEKDDKLQEFLEYTKKYNKEYSTKEEFQKRLEIWKQNYRKINLLNKTPNVSPLSPKYLLAKTKFSKIPSTQYGLNKFSDLTKLEFAEKYLTYSSQSTEDIPILTKNDLNLNEEEEEELPENFDWELDRGIKTKIKEQKDCGACYSFAAVGLIQSQYLMKYGENISFSEQQIIDCDEYNNKCLGGNMKKAFNYLKKNGLMTEEDYPYRNDDGECEYDKNKTLVKVKTFAFIPNDEEEMKKVLYKYGPIAGAVNGIMCMYYDEGIYEPAYEDACPNVVNHAVLIVGYGVNKETGKKFWRIKNSMGQDWGEEGYFRIIRGEGICGINRYTLMADIEKLK